jgi:hypothetical protein
MSDEPKVSAKIESWPVTDVKPYEKNAKIHTPEQIRSIATSIRTYGWDQPIVVDGEGVIIKGHGRFEAAKFLGFKRVPVIIRTDLTAKEAAAARLADNRVAQGDVDSELIQQELEMLAADGDVELSAIGFNDDELKFLTADLGVMDEGALETTGATGTEPAPETGTSVAATGAALAALDEVEVPISKVLGFAKIKGSDENTVATFMQQVESETGLKGGDAFVAWIKELMAIQGK